MSSKSSTDSFSSLADTLGRLSVRSFNEGDPTRKMLFGQINQALQTGGVGQQTPIVQNAVTNSLTSSAGAMKSAKEALGSANLGSDPLSMGILAGINTQSAQQRSQIPTDFAAQLAYGLGPQMSNEATGQGISGLGTAAGINRSSSTTSMDPAQWVQMLMEFMGSRGGGAQGGGSIGSIFV